MTAILLDTDIVISVLRGKSAIIQSMEHALERGESFVVTPITWAEIYAGIRRGEEEAVQKFFQGIRCVPIAESIGKRAGEYLRLFSKSHSVRIADALIGAAATIHDMKLYTLNKKHYPMKDLEFYLE